MSVKNGNLKVNRMNEAQAVAALQRAEDNGNTGSTYYHQLQSRLTFLRSQVKRPTLTDAAQLVYNSVRNLMPLGGVKVSDIAKQVGKSASAVRKQVASLTDSGYLQKSAERVPTYSAV
jgi:hypothetical protein